MDQESLLEEAQKHLIRYASAFAPFVRRAKGSWIEASAEERTT